MVPLSINRTLKQPRPAAVVQPVGRRRQTSPIGICPDRERNGNSVEAVQAVELEEVGMFHSRITERRSERHPLDLSAEFELPWGKIRRVSLTDISHSGCRIMLDDQLLAVGDTVVIRTSALCGAVGEVKWCSDREAGIEFSNEINAHVLGQLLAAGPCETKMIVSRRQSSTAELA